MGTTMQPMMLMSLELLLPLMTTTTKKAGISLREIQTAAAQDCESEAAVTPRTSHVNSDGGGQCLQSHIESEAVTAGNVKRSKQN